MKGFLLVYLSSIVVTCLQNYPSEDVYALHIRTVGRKNPESHDGPPGKQENQRRSRRRVEQEVSSKYSADQEVTSKRTVIEKGSEKPKQSRISEDAKDRRKPIDAAGGPKLREELTRPRDPTNVDEPELKPKRTRRPNPRFQDSVSTKGDLLKDKHRADTLPSHVDQPLQWLGTKPRTGSRELPAIERTTSSRQEPVPKSLGEPPLARQRPSLPTAKKEPDASLGDLWSKWKKSPE